ncbi:hypothetical protein [Streptomyces scabiei]|uniref:hypothetical protein n=1 Tax=Streptomyces scabiei TaxID=1930 RepID=UPI002D21BBF7|nr:hypothetical protein [Streptomyces scabiei]
MVDAALPSRAEGYDFLFSATVWWRPVLGQAVQSDGASPALAVSSVVSRALEVVRHEEPGRASFARYLLEGELSAPLPDRSGRVKALAADVTLALAPADRERLRKLSDLRKDEEVWEYERLHERNKRRYFSDDVLKSAGSAVVWWLARHENEIEKAVGMIGPLAQIAAAAKDEEVPELFRHLLVPHVGARSEATVEDHLRDGHGEEGEVFDPEEELGVSDRLGLLLAAAGLKPDMDGHTVLVHRVVRSLEEEGLDEAAEEIRRTFLPPPDESEDEGPGDWRASDEHPTESWSSDSPAPGSAPFTEAATDMDPGDPGRRETDENDMTPPRFSDSSQG